MAVVRDKKSKANPPRRINEARRSFVCTRVLYKKSKNAKTSGRHGGDDEDVATSSKSKPTSAKAPKVDAFDFTELEADFAKVLGDFRTFVANLNRDGRLRPDDIDALRVKLDKGTQEKLSAVGADIERVGDG